MIPVFNGEGFIGDALSSAASQTYPPNRIIVINDGSTDRTEDIVQSYSSAIPLSCISKPNGGLSSARNVGIAVCKSEYIAFLDCDDMWESGKLEKQIALFENSQFTRLGVVHCNITEMNAHGNTARPAATARSAGAFRGRVLNRLLNSNIPGSGSAVLVRRECFETVGLFDESLPLCEDWDMWLRIAGHYEFDCVNEHLVRIRQHPSSLSTNTDGMIAGRIVVLSKLLKSHPDDPAVLQELRYQVLRLAVHRRLQFHRRDLYKYLGEETVDHLLSDVPGMARAFGKGIAKMAKRLGRRHV